MAVLKQVTVIDPRYKPARWMLEDLEQIASGGNTGSATNSITNNSAHLRR
jgi:hypothetical protein